MPDQDDPKKLGELLDVVSARLPAMMGAIRDTFLSESAGRDFGKAVGAFYKELVASGIAPEQAMAMTSEYINTIKGAISQVQGRGVAYKMGDCPECGPAGDGPGPKTVGDKE